MVSVDHVACIGSTEENDRAHLANSSSEVSYSDLHEECEAVGELESAETPNVTSDHVRKNGSREDLAAHCDPPDIKTTGPSILCLLRATDKPELTHVESFKVVMDPHHDPSKKINHTCVDRSVKDAKRTMLILHGDTDTITNSLKLEKDFCVTVVVSKTK